MYQLPLLEGRLLSQSTMHVACSIPTLLYPNPYRLHNQPSGPHSPFILPKWAPNGELCTPSTAERQMPTFHQRFCCLSFQLHFSHLYQSLEGCICCCSIYNIFPVLLYGDVAETSTHGVTASSRPQGLLPYCKCNQRENILKVRLTN